MQNIKPTDIMFLEYINGLTERNTFITEWRYYWGVDEQKTISKLISLGYLTLKKDIKKNLELQTIPQLKIILKNHQLAVSGNKKALIEKILDNIKIDELEEMFPKKIYTVTPEGEQLINDNYLWVLNRKNNYNFTQEEVNKAYSLGKEYSDNDRVWLIMNDRILRYTKNNKFSQVRMAYYYMAEQLFKEDKYSDALDLYIAVCLIDLSGMQDGYISGLDGTCIAPGIIQRISTIMNLLDINDISPYVINSKFYTSIPHHYFPLGTCSGIINDVLAGKEYDYTNYSHSDNIDFQCLENTDYTTSKSKPKSFWAKLFGL